MCWSSARLKHSLWFSCIMKRVLMLLSCIQFTFKNTSKYLSRPAVSIGTICMNSESIQCGSVRGCTVFTIPEVITPLPDLSHNERVRPTCRHLKFICGGHTRKVYRCQSRIKAPARNTTSRLHTWK